MAAVKDKLFRKDRSLFLPAIASLHADLEMAEHNEPLKRKRGEIAEADGDRRDAKSFRAAIRFLGKGK